MSKTSKAQGREDSRRVTRRSLQAQSLEMEQMHRGAGSGLARALAEEGVLAHVHPVAHLHWSPHMHSAAQRQPEAMARGAAADAGAGAETGAEVMSTEGLQLWRWEKNCAGRMQQGAVH